MWLKTKWHTLHYLSRDTSVKVLKMDNFVPFGNIQNNDCCCHLWQNKNKIKADTFRGLLIKSWLFLLNVSHLPNSKKHKWGKPTIYNNTHHNELINHNVLMYEQLINMWKPEADTYLNWVKILLFTTMMKNEEHA